MLLGDSHPHITDRANNDAFLTFVDGKNVEKNDNFAVLDDKTSRGKN